MTDPYREVEPLACPACGAALRSFWDRLCCDACSGMMLTVEELSAAVGEMVHGCPPLAFVERTAGTRACPRCKRAMTTCQLDVELAGRHPRLEPTLDRCDAHGVWFDVDELASVLAVLHRAGEPPSHATLRQIVRTLLTSYGHKFSAPPHPPLKVD